MEKEKEVLRGQLEDWDKLKGLQEGHEWEVMDKIINELTTYYGNKCLNDPEAISDHSVYLANRGALDGVRAVVDRMNTVVKLGKQASTALDQIERDENG